jgi:hypothetical protein
MRRTILVTLAIIFFALFVIYAGFETWKLVFGPSLVITAPLNFATFNDPKVLLSGKVKRAAYITVNGRPTFADPEGNFYAELLLPPGHSIIRVSVKDRFGKEITKDLSLAFVSTATTSKRQILTATTTIQTGTTTEQTATTSNH